MIKRSIHSERMLIRDLEEGDFSFIKQFYEDYHFYKYAIGSFKEMTKDHFNALLEELKRQDDYFYCVSKLMDTDVYVGAIKGSLHFGHERILWIHLLMIDKKYLRKGYGRELFETIVKYFKEILNIKWIYISVAQKNVSGHSFWIKQGFSDFKTIHPAQNESNNAFGDVMIYRKNAQEI
ncbi:MAG TPA: GNAT family N-acetyltransferase [Defluviitaleaceae bacterium]|nr:GNAT family N-acetyltransferase [Candidatus Epulonipiscium sp.]HOQ17860.1 GNAT family N-acetyltransferase [Defluviitaleaceae bacterium]HPT77453.1 GNAT family N-acetyltransferase [Defluviitaleaceae bacterium]HQD50531.1 GNAT family N-acetyltransferase [Defluviitaleaceae bacterium]